MPTSEEVLASLREDKALEHAAIIQYVINGVVLRDAAITDPVRKIAREEMWHFEWLSEAIRDRGGEQSLDRAEVFLPPSIAKSMLEDVAAEDRALSHYARTLALVGDSDAELTELIERIVADERHHHATFERLAAEVGAAGDAAYAPRPITGPADLGVVGPTIGTEYRSILQYLLSKYGCGDCDRGERYFEFAVDEMRHLSWVASYVAGLADPVPPDVPYESVRAVHSIAEASEASGVLEKTAAAFYPPMIDDAISDALREDLARALGQHDFHRKALGRMG